MTKQIHEAEIDLFELIQILWKGKFIIIAAMITSTLCGLYFFNTKDKSYQAHIHYTLDYLPPFISARRADSDLKQYFFSSDVYQAWRKLNSNAEISYKDINPILTVNGFKLTKNPRNSMARFVLNKKERTLLVKSNSLSLLNEYYSYLNHVNSILTADYISQSKNRLVMIENTFGDLGKSNDIVANNILDIVAYFSDVERGEMVFKIQHVSPPTLLGPKKRMVLLLSAMIGGIFGVVCALFVGAMHKRRARLK